MDCTACVFPFIDQGDRTPRAPGTGAGPGGHCGAPPPPAMIRTPAGSVAMGRNMEATQAASPASSPSCTGAGRSTPAPTRLPSHAGSGVPPLGTMTGTGSGATVSTPIRMGSMGCGLN
ncbi:unnamed protein product, partial [Caretta caretta]